MEKRNIGILVISVSLLVWLVDRLTYAVSSILGKIICGDRYMQPVDGIIGDPSCGFNIDMHLTYLLITVLILGIVLYISSHQRDSVKEF